VSKEASSFFTGFFLGALIGGAAALLMAPQSGEETRTQIHEKSVELREKAEATYGDLIKKVEESTQELRQKTEELSAKLDEVIAQGKEELAKLRKPEGAEQDESAQEIVIEAEETPAEA
jgi:gas vesicle protein